MRKRLRRGVDVRTALQIGVGGPLADKVVGAARRAKLRDIRAPQSLIRTAKSGRAYLPPTSARAELGELVHDANADIVRNIATLFVLICSWLGPTGKTGHDRQKHFLRVDVLAEKLAACTPSGKCSVREVERYLTVLRSAGVLACWQPPSSSGLPKGKFSGRCFNLYTLVGDIPPELERELADFHRVWWPRRAAAALVPPGKPLDALSIASALKARAAPS